MRKALAVTIFLILGLGPVSFTLAASSSASGPTALALAAVVAQHSSLLNPQEKDALARLFNAEVKLGLPAGQKITVKTASVICRMSSIDIAERSCAVTFGTKTITLKGREANELSATASAAGVGSEGGAGTIFTSFSNLVCTIDPQEIKQKTGGGATCTFDTEQ